MLPRLPRALQRALTLLPLLGGAVVLPLPGLTYADVRVVPPVVGEVVIPALAGVTDVALPFPARHLGVHWRGPHDAAVQLAWSVDGIRYTAPTAVVHDETMEGDAVTWGAIVFAPGATRARVTSAQRITDVTVVDLAEGPARIERQRVERAAAAAVPAPSIVTRAQWGADESKRTTERTYGTIKRMVVHHTATTLGLGETVEEHLRGIYAYHTQSRGWADIGYNFLIGPDGRIFEGRWARDYPTGALHDGEDTSGKGVVGAHAEGNNTGSVGISMVGNFQTSAPPDAAVDSLVDMLAWEAERHDVDPLGTTSWSTGTLPTIVGHRDIGSTECPGGTLYAQLPVMRQLVHERLLGGGRLQPITPARVIDTRTTTGGFIAPIGQGQTRTVIVRGMGGVPESGVSAVVVNVTAIAPTAAGYLTVFPNGSARPTASTLGFRKGQTVPSLLMVGLPANGALDVYNSAGDTHVAIDVVGWYDDQTAPATAKLASMAPTRLLDTRQGAGALPPDGTRSLAVGGTNGVPSDAVAVLLNVTGISPTAASHLTVWPSGESRPGTSNLNLAPGRTAPNLVLTGLGPDGAVQLYNAAGYTHIAVDVVGWYGIGTAANGRFTPVGPARLIDTRESVPLGPSGFRVVTVSGKAQVPASAAAVAMTVTVTAPTSAGYLTAYASDGALPGTSNLNFTTNETVANLVVVPLSSAGKVAFYNSGGTTHVVADVVGWFSKDA